jgi:HindIII restriction endonuclease
MSRSDRIKFIEEIAPKLNAFDILEAELALLSQDNLIGELFDCGIIPEQFPPSSSAEKIWAKYCDILLAKGLTFLGIDAQVIRTRGDSADVLGVTPDYTIVGDAKAFWLSRIAKNQKDFKITALDDWRRENTFS